MSRDTSTIEHGEHSANWPFMSMSQWLDCLPEQAIPPIWSQYMGQRPLIIFDPEIIKETITEASKCFEEHYHCDPYPILENISTYQISQQILLSKTLDYILGGEQHEPIIKEESSDRRFKHPLWNDNPYFSYLKQSYLLTANMLNESAKFLKGIDGDNKRRFKFYMKQVIDASSPANFPATNPQVIEETVKTNGKNLMKGYLSLLEHLNDNPYSFPIRMTDPKAFNLGENIAATKGSVVFKNHLFELIHYHATKSNVGSVPLLIVPPWIKKFYIFDLQKENSFIQWMLDRGIDVFMMSWVNPDKNHADQTLENYILDGIHYAIQKIIGLKGVSRINAMGYCTGGIALTTLLAYLGKIGEDTKINSATILAAPINFDKAGDLKTFVCQRQLNLLEKYVQKKGFLDADAVQLSFNLLRPGDLIWNTFVNNYLLGKDPPALDLLYWNDDPTRMPGKMHLEYLRKMYFENGLINPGSIYLKGVQIDLGDIVTPLFVVATKDDHIAPWESVFDLMHYVSGPATFLLSGSGHVAGVINHPNKNKYHYWTSDRASVASEEWLKNATENNGSWWPYWFDWLHPYLDRFEKPNIFSDSTIGPAPGTYVFQG